MSERPFMQLYVSQYLGDTKMLSCEQHGAYLLLLMTMWNAGGRLPDDDAKLARITCLTVKKWRAIRDDVLDFFDVADGVISHNRVTKELQKIASKSELRAAAGAKGGAAKSLKTKNVAVANATDLLPGLPQHIEKIEDRKREDANASSTRAKPAETKAEFEKWWALYPNKVGKADALKKFEAARKKASVEALLDGLRSYIETKPADRQWCNPATWLNQERWLDRPAVVVSLPTSRPIPATTANRTASGLLAELARRHGENDHDQHPADRELDLTATRVLS